MNDVMTNDKLTKIIRETISLFRASLMQDAENDDPSYLFNIRPTGPIYFWGMATQATPRYA